MQDVTDIIMFTTKTRVLPIADFEQMRQPWTVGKKMKTSMQILISIVHVYTTKYA